MGDFERRLRDINAESDQIFGQFEVLEKEVNRVYGVIKNTGFILDDLDAQFEKKTALTKVDVAFLFLAVGLQIARQYLLTKFPTRLSDQDAADSTLGHNEEKSNRHHRYYKPSLEEIISNPVPFDANLGSDGFLYGGGRLGHRGATLGHDPILGLIFGTANIATSTITNIRFESRHVHTESNRDILDQNANTISVINYTVSKLLHEGIEGRVKVAAALGKEVIHLRSDLDTKNSLPLPILTTISPAWAADLAKYGFDTSNIVTVSKQVTYSVLINSIISMLHGAFFDGQTEDERKRYNVRTLKIIDYSNIIASGSNLLYVGITKDFSKLDLGGLGVTIYRMLTDSKVIRALKYEYIFGQYDKQLYGNQNSEYHKLFGEY